MSQLISQIKEGKRTLFRRKEQQRKKRVVSDSAFRCLSDLLSQLNIWKKGVAVASYHALSGEMSPEYFFNKYKKQYCFVFPKTTDNLTTTSMKFVSSHQGWEDSSWSGGRQPVDNKQVPLNKISVFLVPALAFDREGRRLGRGGGYYDRVLSQTSGIKVGLAWDDQISNEALPEESHDVRMDAIVTNNFLLMPLRNTQIFKGVN